MPPSQETDERPTPLLPPQTPRRPLFGFGEPTAEETAGPRSSSRPGLDPSTPLTELTDDELEALAQDSGTGWPSDEDDESSEPTSSPASTPAGDVGGVLDSDGLRDVFRGGVIIAGDQAHTYLARSEGQKAVGLYATDQEDAERIGDPLARIAGRHQGVGPVNEDTRDLLAAMVGLTRYATKQIQRSQVAKQYDTGVSTAPAEPVDV